MLYTIGYGNKPAADLVERLKEYGIKHLIDVRSRPYGRDPQLHRETLKERVEAAGIVYLWRGNELGGLEGPVSDLAIKRLLQYIAMEAPARVAIMCAEGKWRDCHRHQDIGMRLYGDMPVFHIEPDGTVTVIRGLHDLAVAEGQLSLL